MPTHLQCPSRESRPRADAAKVSQNGAREGRETGSTPAGPRLIEINARMGGGQVRKTHLLASGVDLVEETLFTSVGIPCNPHVSVDGAAVAYGRRAEIRLIAAAPRRRRGYFL